MRRIVGIFLFATIMGLLYSFVGCSQSSYVQVEEEAYDRWIVRFILEYPNDLQSDSIEYSLLDLKEKQENLSPFTITFSYDEQYQEEAIKDIEFTLEPQTEFYYVDDEGQKVLVNNLATENKYYFMRDQLQVLDGEAMHHTQRIFEKGEYRLTYAFGTKVSFTGDPVDAICKFWINIILK